MASTESKIARRIVNKLKWRYNKMPTDEALRRLYKDIAKALLVARIKESE